MHQLILSTLAFAFMSLGTVAMAAELALDKYDSKFLITASQAGNLEIHSSEIAQKRLLAPEEISFAKKIVADHTAMAHELEALASKKGVTLPKDIDEKGQKKMDALSATKETAFAEAYVDSQVSAHKEAVSIFKDAAENAKDADVRAFATKYIPTLNQHLDAAKTLVKNH